MNASDHWQDEAMRKQRKEQDLQRRVLADRERRIEEDRASRRQRRIDARQSTIRKTLNQALSDDDWGTIQLAIVWAEQIREFKKEIRP